MPSGDLVGVMLIARNLEYLSQVQSTIRYSRKLAALGRLSAGVAHEVKNPLNAMMIHLELLRQQFQRAASRADAGGALARAGRRRRLRPPPRRSDADPAERCQHVDVIAAEIRRLDEVVQGFLKFTPSRGSQAAAGRACGRCSTRSFRSCGPRPTRAERSGARRRATARRRRQRRSGDAAPGVSQPGAQRLSGDAKRRHRCASSASRSRGRRVADRASPTPASVSSRSTCNGSSICISRHASRRRHRAFAWSIARSRCTMVR